MPNAKKMLPDVQVSAGLNTPERTSRLIIKCLTF
ncbi:MAG: hypothetical protein JWP78_2011 [Mucilaginibacter sp.]|nr:hypothetical protein [Mucilaginibacter sp.]